MQVIKVRKLFQRTLFGVFALFGFIGISASFLLTGCSPPPSGPGATAASPPGMSATIRMRDPFTIKGKRMDSGPGRNVRPCAARPPLPGARQCRAQGRYTVHDSREPAARRVRGCSQMPANSDRTRSEPHRGWRGEVGPIRFPARAPTFVESIRRRQERHRLPRRNIDDIDQRIDRRTGGSLQGSRTQTNMPIWPASAGNTAPTARPAAVLQCQQQRHDQHRANDADGRVLPIDADPGVLPDVRGDCLHSIAAGERAVRTAARAPRTVDNPVADWRARDNPVPGIEDLDPPVPSRSIATGAQFALQSQDSGFRDGQKRDHTGFAALALRRPQQRARCPL